MIPVDTFRSTLPQICAAHGANGSYVSFYCVLAIVAFHVLTPWRQTPAQPVFDSQVRSQYRYKTIETLRRLQQDSSPNTPCQRPGPLPCQSGFTYRHNKTQNTNVRTQPLAYPCRLPEDAERPIFVPVEDGGNDTVNIG